MEIKINKLPDKTYVTLNGRIDSTNADQFQNDIFALLEGDCKFVDIDCSEMSYTSSQGLRVFLLLQKSLIERHGNLVMRNMNPHVKEVFDITGFSNIITIL